MKEKKESQGQKNSSFLLATGISCQNKFSRASFKMTRYFQFLIFIAFFRVMSINIAANLDFSYVLNLVLSLRYKALHCKSKLFHRTFKFS